MTWTLLIDPTCPTPAALEGLPRWAPGDRAAVVAVTTGLRHALRGPLAPAWDALTGSDHETALFPVWAGGAPADLPDELVDADIAPLGATPPPLNAP